MANDDPTPGGQGDQFDQLGGEEGSGFVPPSEETTDALLGAVGFDERAADFSGMIDLGDRYLGMRTADAGEKLKIARAVERYGDVGADCVAHAVNDLLSDGLTPVAFITYFGVKERDEAVAGEVATGIAEGAEQAGILLFGGRMGVKPDVLTGVDLVGTAAGVGNPSDVYSGEAAEGDRLVGFPSSGIHSAGLETARSVLLEEYEYADTVPGADTETIADRLLRPTRLYTYLTDHLRDSIVHAAVQITDGGFQSLSQMGEYRYSITDPLEPQPVFDLIQDTGDLDTETMYRTFTMGTGFVVAVPESAANELVSETDGEIVGIVERGSGIAIRGLEIE
ncbi:MAG: AIR synthase-related protein [Halodesulfurarchaeum sp.]